MSVKYIGFFVDPNRKVSWIPKLNKFFNRFNCTLKRWDLRTFPARTPAQKKAYIKKYKRNPYARYGYVGIIPIGNM